MREQGQVKGRKLIKEVVSLGRLASACPPTPREVLEHEPHHRDGHLKRSDLPFVLHVSKSLAEVWGRQGGESIASRSRWPQLGGGQSLEKGAAASC